MEWVKDRVIRLKQSRYLIDPEKEGQGLRSPYNYKWDVYLTYITNNHPKDVESKWLRTHEDFVEITVPSGKLLDRKIEIPTQFVCQ